MLSFLVLIVRASYFDCRPSYSGVVLFSLLEAFWGNGIPSHGVRLYLLEFMGHSLVTFCLVKLLVLLVVSRRPCFFVPRKVISSLNRQPSRFLCEIL
jgi:hypothetical protein